jgi:D-serine deaminase-like pyridoxal phosphate-dependent protein
VYTDVDLIAQIIEQLKKSSLTRFAGFLTHSGHTYQAASREEVMQINRESLTQMRKLKARFIAERPLISVGDTPSCSLADDFAGADELRPGNFVFYDLMQSYIGSCATDDIAVAVACPVVAKYPHRSELVIYGGAIHLSKDALRTRNGEKSFGRAALLHETGWKILPEGNEMVSVSQEHGVVKIDDQFMNQISVGSLLGVIPVHSCLTAHQLKQYQTFEGDVIKMMG